MADQPAWAGALAALTATGVTPRLAASLARSASAAAARLRDTVVAEVEAFSTADHPEVLSALDRHAREHIDELQRLLAGSAPGDLAFVRTHAHHSAEQRFPLEATLHAYRCAHKVLASWMRDAAIALRPRQRERIVAAVADFALEYANAISTILAAEYVAHTRALAEAEGDRRTELLGLLIAGYDEADARVARLLKRAGYLDARQSFCVALVQSTDPLEMESPTRAQRIVEAVTKAVAARSIRVLVGVRNHVVTAVFSDVRRASGWTAPRPSLEDRLEPALALLGPAVLTGLSSDQPSTALIPRGLHEAMVALDCASVAERVVRFSRLPIRRLLVQRATETVRDALPIWLARLNESDRKLHGALVKTLRALADADLNVQAAARRLIVHPNTIYARIARIIELTRLDGLKHHDLTELLLAIDCDRNP